MNNNVKSLNFGQEMSNIYLFTDWILPTMPAEKAFKGQYHKPK